ncbi:hypothetical protein F5X68DRAFT_226167 [Plectosphaerella plurivora]|uniref:Uncharacterized protein n=1 Tax=Plectosphaerella plurivora TaxID=936078 RepID=A0A9P9A0V1_9PEZI|nr:hypothetical protein F5X68DRAFT_226167 [Plectosphaerella plurivora]
MTRHLATLRDQIPPVRASSKLIPSSRKPPAGCPASGLPPPNRPPEARRARSLEPILIPKGCSPWRPAAVMSTTWRENYSLPRIFKGRRGRTGPSRSAGLFRPLNPISGQTDSRDRLTHVQPLFTWNLSPLRSFKFSLKSALEAASSPTSTSAYSSTRRASVEGEVWVGRLSAIHFQG